MHPFIQASIGGLLIGLATSLFLLLKGRVFGISGIIGGLLKPKQNDILWRLLVLLGLLAGGFLSSFLVPSSFSSNNSNVFLLVVSGFLVGFGTQLGGGCTSGHGVCGLSRLSKRSIVATIVFMFFGMLTVFLAKFGGLL